MMEEKELCEREGEREGGEGGRGGRERGKGGREGGRKRERRYKKILIMCATEHRCMQHLPPSKVVLVTELEYGPTPSPVTAAILTLNDAY